VKLETYLRIAGIPYELANGEPTDAPKGKVPWIVDRHAEGEVTMGDSSLIIHYLKSAYGDAVDGWLNDEQFAVGHATQRMLEENLYYVSSYSKWVDDQGFDIYSAALFKHLPDEQKDTVPAWVRGKVIAKLQAQGIARHTPEEVYAIGGRDIEAFGVLLGDKPYLLGDKPSSFDASALGVIGNIKDGPFPVPIRAQIRNTANVASYINRMRATFFPDLEE
jgi:glutathione S-transferase